jgi:hypothetical protein
MSLSKKIRFEVLKRDGFKCGYCGKTPPDVILEVDHIVPVSDGGKDDIINLITSCFDCNRGKSNISLHMITPQMNENLEVLKEKEEQLKEYRKYAIKINKRIEKDIDTIQSVFIKSFEDKCFSQTFRKSIKIFLTKIPVIDLCDHMESACIKKYNDPDDALKYFCGICWNIIKNRNIF